MLNSQACKRPHKSTQKRPLKLLLIEDEHTMRRTLERTLTRSGWQVSSSGDGLEGLRLWGELTPDVVLLDLSLPGLDGLRVLEEGRKQGLLTPVILLTARGTVGDRILGLNAGADDYLPKPFDLDELDARIKALLRRSQRPPADDLKERDHKSPHAGHLRLDPDSGAIVGPQGVLDISPREARMLQLLIQRAGQAVTKEQLFNHVFRDELEVNIEAVEVVAYRLRKKLQNSGTELVTLRGLGYLLKTL